MERSHDVESYAKISGVLRVLRDGNAALAYGTNIHFAACEIGHNADFRKHAFDRKHDVFGWPLQAVRNDVRSEAPHRIDSVSGVVAVDAVGGLHGQEQVFVPVVYHMPIRGSSLVLFKLYTIRTGDGVENSGEDRYGRKHGRILNRTTDGLACLVSTSMAIFLYVFLHTCTYKLVYVPMY